MRMFMMVGNDGVLKSGTQKLNLVHLVYIVHLVRLCCPYFLLPCKNIIYQQ